MAGNFTGGPFELRVLKPNAEGRYSYGAISGPASPIGVPQTFGTALPISAGDIVALEVPDESAVAFIELSGSQGYRALAQPPVAEGLPWEGKPVMRPGVELAFNADVLALPSVSAITPASGAVSGGSSVTINGSSFSEVRKVSFGGAAATSYTVNAEDSITATAPPTTMPGVVDVTVTTAAGTSPIATSDGFTYVATPPPAQPPSPPPSPRCKVPDLREKALKAAKKKIRAADCKVGRVMRGRRTGSEVVGQKPRPGTVVAPGTEVDVKVGTVRDHPA